MFTNRLRRWDRFVALYLLLGIVVLLLSACRREQGPVEVVRSFMAAVETFNIAEAQSLVCQRLRDKVQESLAPFNDVKDLGEAFEVRLDDLVFQEQSNDGKVAVVRVSGKLTIAFLGQQETQVVDEEHVIVRESGRWLVCDP